MFRLPIITVDGLPAIARAFVHSGLFRKYVAIFAAVLGSALLINGLINIWFMYDDNRASLGRLQMEQASAAASKITQFVGEIEAQIGWTTHLSWALPDLEQRELDARRLLRQVPAISELVLLDPQGRERLHLSRQAEDKFDGNRDFSSGESFKTAIAEGEYYGPVYFRRETEPYMTLSVAGSRRDRGVTVAEVNLKHIWDVISQIKIGDSGRAYVVGPTGRLIAHPDISLVLRNMDLADVPQVRLARTGAGSGSTPASPAFDLYGNRVLTTHIVAKPLGWLIFVELGESEANAPLYVALVRWLVLTVLGLLLALVPALLLARHMVVPIQSLAHGAEQIGIGTLDHRISIHTGDELESLAHQFNRMASQLQSSYAGLERKVEERTQQLRDANTAKSRFLAIASHDLRQPLHALNLFVAQLGLEVEATERVRLETNIRSSIDSMNALFNELLDISRLDAGVLNPRVAPLAINGVLARIEITFAAAAREKGLHFRVIPSSAWVESDPVLLERIIMNLVSNAVRYTATGGVVVGCRHIGGTLRVDVCDSGVGIAPDEQRRVFTEFYRIKPDGMRSSEGLGLGLAIVERLSQLLRHPLELSSVQGNGTRFSILLPRAATPRDAATLSEPPLDQPRSLAGKLIVVIDDDPAVLAGTHGLLLSWGCRVVAEASAADAIVALAGTRPDLIVSDLHLAKGNTGIAAIRQLELEFGGSIPAFVVSGDISTGQSGKIGPAGHVLLHKPVSPVTLRAMVTSMLSGASTDRMQTVVTSQRQTDSIRMP